MSLNNADDVVWVDVMPALEKLMPTLRRAVPKAGREAGQDFGRSFTAAAAQKVEASSAKMSAALRKVEDAAGRVNVAEARLQQLRASGRATDAQLVAAEERLAAARRGETAANEALSAATRNVQRAQAEATTAARLAERAQQGQARSAGLLAAAQDRQAASAERSSLLARTMRGTLSGLGAVARNAWAPVSLALVAAGGLGVKTASDLEQARIAFTNMLGSAKAADAFIAQMQDFAAKTPFEFKDVTRGAQRLMAMGINAKDVLPYLTAIGDAVSAMGGGAEQIDQVTTAIGQMSAKGKIQSDELLQLTEAGIPALKILANEYGVTTGQMQDMVSAGDVMSSKALPKLIDGIEHGTKTTQAFGGMMAKQSDSLAGLWSTATDTVRNDLASMITPLIPSLKTGLAKGTELLGGFLKGVSREFGVLKQQLPNLLSAFKDGDFQGMAEVIDNIFGNTGKFVGPIRDALSVVVPLLGHLKDLAVGLIPSVKNLGGIFGKVGGTLSGLVAGSLSEIVAVMADQLAPILKKITGWLKDHMAVVWALVGAYAAIKVAILAQEAAMAVGAAGGLLAWIRQAKAIAAVEKAWAAVQWLLNAALEANPIVLIVTALAALGAALYLAWTHSSTFRKIVVEAWQAISDAAQWAWQHILKPVIDALVTAWNAVSHAFEVAGAAIVTAWNAVADAFQWAWQHILQPVWHALQTAASAYWNYYLHPIITAVIAAWNGMATAAQWAWTHILQPTWNAISAAASWLWNSVLKPIWAAMQWWWNGLLTAMQFAWTHVLQPTWNAIAGAASWLYNTILLPIWHAMQSTWAGLLAAIQGAWLHILQPTWNAISTAASWLWGVLKTVFSTIGDAWHALGDGFAWVYHHVIEPIIGFFSGLIDALKDGFQKAVDFIGKVWDGIRKVLLTPVQWVIDVVWNNGLRKLWNGINNIWGGDDIRPYKIPGLAAGGFFNPGGGVSPSGGPGRKALADGGMMPGYTPGRDVHRFYSATGGVLELSGGEPVLRPELGRVLGQPWVDAANAAARSGGVAGARDFLARTLIGQRQAHAAGGIVTLGSRVLDFASSNPVGRFLTQMSIGGGFLQKLIDYVARERTVTRNHGSTPIWTTLGDMARDGANKLWQAVKHAVGGWLAPGGGGYANYHAELAKRAAAAAQANLGNLGTGAFSASSLANLATAGVAQAVRQAANAYGWGSGPQWDALSWIISHESGWRPTAQNPTSTAYGLFQFLNSTWASVGGHKTADPFLQGVYGTRYIAGRYGTPIAAEAFWQAHHWYKDGGFTPTVFDTGGLMPPKSIGLNLTDGFERVLTPPQDNMTQRLIEANRGAGPAGPAEFRGDLYLDSGEFLGKVRGVAEAVVDRRDRVDGRNLRSAR